MNKRENQSRNQKYDQTSKKHKPNKHAFEKKMQKVFKAPSFNEILT